MHTEEWRKNWKKPIIRHMKLTPWFWVVSHPENLALGERTDIGAFTFIECTHAVYIGTDVQIGSHCTIYTHNTIDGTHGAVTLDHGCHIGTHTVIMPGVYIGNGAKIGAFSLVKTNIPAGEVWAGIPAERISTCDPLQ